jgi:hypothetical protein
MVLMAEDLLKLVGTANGDLNRLHQSGTQPYRSDPENALLPHKTCYQDASAASVAASQRASATASTLPALE